MTSWIKVYNSMPSHPKFLMVGDRASWLFVCGCCYSNEHLTDGFIPQHVLPVVAPGVKVPERLAERLVEAELWHAVDGGWRIHDYDDHQRSADQIRDQRAKDAERKAGVREKSARSPNGQTTDSRRNPSGVRDVEKSREEKRLTSSLRSDVVELFAYWQERCDHKNAKLTLERRRKIDGRLKEHYTVSQIRTAIDGAARAAFVNDQGRRFDDIELICRNGSKLEDFMERATARPVRPVASGRRENASDMLRAINGGGDAA